MYKGSCLCGDVSYELSGELREPVACHCSQCRKTSGHYWAATQVAKKDFALTESKGLKWYKSSDYAKRGFCKSCGSSLFWDMAKEEFISIAAGTLESPTGLNIGKHIFCADKGDYYEIEEGVIQLDKY